MNLALLYVIVSIQSQLLSPGSRTNSVVPRGQQQEQRRACTGGDLQQLEAAYHLPLPGFAGSTSNAKQH